MPRCMSNSFMRIRRFAPGGTISQGMSPNLQRMYDLDVARNSIDPGKIERLAAAWPSRRNGDGGGVRAGRCWERLSEVPRESGRRLLRVVLAADGALAPRGFDFLAGVAEHVAHDLGGVLAEQR